MSLRDPSLTRPGRVIFAAVIFIAALAAAVLAGWGWLRAGGSSCGTGGGFGDSPPAGACPGAPIAAIFVGQSGAIGLLIATGFALPRRWRAGSIAGPLMLGLSGLELVAASAGMGVALASSPGTPSPVAAIVVAGLGVALLLSAALLRTRSVRRAAASDTMVRTGVHVAGLVTDREQTAMINNVPRWRVVVRFADTSGTTRWVTKHSTTFSPPDVGQPVNVWFDPSHPDRQHDIVVSW